MTITIRNQKHAILYNAPFKVLPNIDPTLPSNQYIELIEEHIREKYVKPMYTPLNANTSVIIEDLSNGSVKTIDEDTLFNGINYVWNNPTLDVDLEEQLTDIYKQGIQYISQNDWYFDEQLGVEALTKMKLPVSSASTGRIVKYTPTTDIIPASKQLLANNTEDNTTNWFANMAGYLHDKPFNNFMLLTVKSNQELDNIKDLLKNNIALWQNQHTIDTNNLQILSDFDNIDLIKDLSTAIFLPNNGGATDIEKEPLSFTRMLTYVLAEYETHNPGKLMVQPINLKQIYFPENIIIINLENYAHALAEDVVNEWDLIQKAVFAKQSLNFASNKKIMTAKSVMKTISQSGMNPSANNENKEIIRLEHRPLHGKPVNSKDMIKMMSRVISTQITRQKTENTYKTVKNSYMRANRRKPDDINLPGKLTIIKYRPDIHVYLDTSGSISESHFKDSIITLIRLTQKIDCNLYFTSFSSVVSQTTLLKTKGKSYKQVYREFMRVPKVTGGTEYENVWKKIDMLDMFNKRNAKSHQINFIITDFEYSISRNRKWDRSQASLKHTYYVPISAEIRSWDKIVKDANNFMRQMVKAGDYGLRPRMLM